MAYCSSASPPSPVDRVINLNDRGVLGLVTGEESPRLSVSAFKAALTGIGQICSPSSCAVSDDKVMESSSKSSMSVTCKAIRMREFEFQEEDFYVFDHAVVFQYESGKKPVTMSAEEATFCSAIITFNLALTYHKTGRHSGDGGRLQTASYLYQKCIEMSISAAEAQMGEDMLMLQLVAGNNAAHIMYTLARFDECQDILYSNHCRAHSLVHKMGSFCEPEQDTLIVKEQLEEIILNMAVLSVPLLAPMA